MIKEYDFIAIGGGSGGYAAARVARESTGSVAIVDGAEQLGGLCILRGCMPSKTLIYSAEALHLAQNARKLGLVIPEARADMKAIHARKVATIAEFADYRVKSLESGRFDLYRSYATFIDSHTIQLSDGARLRGKKIVVATGSAVFTPPILGLDHPDVWTSDDVLELDFLPESVVVLGGGVVACELVQFLQRVGTKVIQIQRSSRVLKTQPDDVSEVVEKAFRDEGVELYTDTELLDIERTGDGFIARFMKDGKVRTAAAKHALNALGRRPANDRLGLENAGVELQKNGQIKIDEFQRTTNPDIYAAGDCAGPVEIVHVAVMQGELVGRHAFGKPCQPINYDHMLEVIFTDPQVARVGLNAEELAKRDIDFIAADYPYDDHGKTILMEAKRGFARVFAERATGRILGAEIVAKDAGELIHVFSLAVANNLTAADMMRAHWYHPTIAEIVTYPLEEIAEQIS